MFLRCPDAPFRAALLLSALAHLAMLSLFRPPVLMPQAKPGAGATLLTVVLDAQPVAPAYPQSPSPQKEELPRALAETPPVPSAAAPAPRRPDDRAPPAEPPSPASGSAQQTAPAAREASAPAFVDRRPPVIQEGMATAFLQIGEDGRVLQIIWDQVPVVTPEELLQMEMELRQRQYPATGTAYHLAELIQVPHARPPVSTAAP